MTQELSLKQAQQEVDEWIRTVGVRYFSELTNLGILMEEVGSCRVLWSAVLVTSRLKSDLDKNLEDEMADVLWVLMCLANQTGVDLSAAFRRNMDKRPNVMQTVTRKMKN